MASLHGAVIAPVAAMIRIFVLLIVLGLAAPAVSYADPILFTKRGPGVSALFEIDGDTMRITVRKAGETGSQGALADAGGGLPSVLFDLPAGISLTPVATEAGSLAAGEVVYTMAIAGGTLLESDISNVSFQYGTGPGDPTLPPGMRLPKQIPEPGLMVLLAAGLGLAARRVRRTKPAR